MSAVAAAYEGSLSRTIYDGPGERASSPRRWTLSSAELKLQREFTPSFRGYALSSPGAMHWLAGRELPLRRRWLFLHQGKWFSPLSHAWVGCTGHGKKMSIVHGHREVDMFI